jgi:HlyD family secretion protein
MVLEDGVLHERTLEIGIRNWNFTEVRDGVAVGETVVISLDQAGIEDGAEAEAVAEAEAR